MRPQASAIITDVCKVLCLQLHVPLEAVSEIPAQQI